MTVSLWRHHNRGRNLGRPYSTLARQAYSQELYVASALLFRVSYQKTRESTTW